MCQAFKNPDPDSEAALFKFEKYQSLTIWYKIIVGYYHCILY